RTDEWQALRDLRLRALADAPLTFSATLDEAMARTDEWWREAARRGAEDENWVTYVAVHDGDLVGMATGDFPGDGLHVLDDPTIASLIQMWVDPSERRSGVGGDLVEAVASWAAAHRSPVLRTAVTQSQTRAIAFYESLGFRD